MGWSAGARITFGIQVESPEDGEAYAKWEALQEEWDFDGIGDEALAWGLGYRPEEHPDSSDWAWLREQATDGLEPCVRYGSYPDEAYTTFFAVMPPWGRDDDNPTGDLGAHACPSGPQKLNLYGKGLPAKEVLDKWGERLVAAAEALGLTIVDGPGFFLVVDYG